MPLLVKKPDEIKEHWHAVANGMGRILPGATNTYRAVFEDRAVATATLKCQNFPQEIAARHNGVEAPVVPLIAALPDDSPVYWMSWFEEWIAESKVTSRRRQFQSSAITVYYGLIGEPKRQLFRAEWAGVQRIEKETDVFPGGWAAHPHWHVDAIRGYVDDIGRQIEAIRQETELKRELALGQVREFGDGQAENDVAGLLSPLDLQLPSNAELGWTGIHLAAGARWAEQIWPGPEGPNDVHAKGPVDLEALRYWLTSCVRYIQAEINLV